MASLPPPPLPPEPPKIHKVNHILHLLLSLVTFGTWIPVWALIGFLRFVDNRNGRLIYDRERAEFEQEWWAWDQQRQAAGVAAPMFPPPPPRVI